MDNLSLDDLSLFSAVADAGSIVGAARRLRQPKSTVSRRLQVLEERLGVRLIERTTRRLALTDTGQALFERARPALLMLSEAAARGGWQPARAARPGAAHHRGRHGDARFRRRAGRVRAALSARSRSSST